VQLTWNKYGGYGKARFNCGALLPAVRLRSRSTRYPYKAGHYPTADAYYDLPPYADINPNFYSWRYFLMAQERNRYRYVPHIFHRSEAQCWNSRGT
jgi:hypothetical protein